MIELGKDAIESMSHEEMAKFWRFALMDHEYFTNLELYEIFILRFRGFGGMTSEISKKIGWSKEPGACIIKDISRYKDY